MTSHLKHRVWPVQDAKAHFSEMLDATVKQGPQIVSKRGVETAVLVPIGGMEAVERKATANFERAASVR